MSFVMSCVIQRQPPKQETPRSSLEELSTRCTALHRVGVDAQLWWGSLREEWKIDKEFVLKALTESPNLPPNWDFEDRFPLWLKFDRDVVLEFVNRLAFLNSLEQRPFRVCPDMFRGDKEVMLAYCTCIPASLQDCSVGEFMAV